MNLQVRGKRIGGSEEEVDIRSSRGGGLAVAQLVAPYALLAASDVGAIAAAATAVASVTAIPTTTAMGTLWNGEAGGGKSYIIDRLFFDTWATDSEHHGHAHLVACIHPVGMSAPTADITIKKLQGGTYGGLARFDIGATVVNDTWYSWGNSIQTNTDDAGGAAFDLPVEGRIVLPPTAGLSLSVVSNDADATVKVGVSWFEVQLDLG